MAGQGPLPACALIDIEVFLIIGKIADAFRSDDFMLWGFLYPFHEQLLVKGLSTIIDEGVDVIFQSGAFFFVFNAMMVMVMAVFVVLMFVVIVVIIMMVLFLTMIDFVIPIFEFADPRGASRGLVEVE